MIRFNYDLLRQLRKRRGWKQADVARKLNCAGATISKWELGDSKITAEDLAKLLSLYSVKSADGFFVHEITRNKPEDSPP